MKNTLELNDLKQNNIGEIDRILNDINNTKTSAIRALHINELFCNRTVNPYKWSAFTNSNKKVNISGISLMMDVGFSYEEVTVPLNGVRVCDAKHMRWIYPGEKYYKGIAKGYYIIDRDAMVQAMDIRFDDFVSIKFDDNSGKFMDKGNDKVIVRADFLLLGENCSAKIVGPKYI